MAKVIHPLFSGDVRGNFGKKFIFRRGGIVTRYFVPKDARSILQLAARQAFTEMVMSFLSQEQADLLYAAIAHLHDDRYSVLAHGHDHGVLTGLADDDHSQYFNQNRGDARYPLIAHNHDHGALTGLADDDHTQYLNQTRGDARYLQSVGLKNGESVLGANFAVTGSAGVFQDTGLNITLPSAGTYLISADVRGDLTGSAGTLWWLTVKFYNSTDAADVTNSERLVVLTATGAVNFQMTCPINCIVTVAASKTIKLYAARNGSGSPTWARSNIATGAFGQTKVSYFGF